MMRMSLSVGSLRQSDSVSHASHLLGVQAHRPRIDSSSFQISVPVEIINRNSGIPDGLSVTMYHVPLNRYTESKIVQPD